MEKTDTGTLGTVNTATSTQAVIELFQAGMKYCQLKCARNSFLEVTTTNSVHFPIFLGLEARIYRLLQRCCRKPGKEECKAFSFFKQKKDLPVIPKKEADLAEDLARIALRSWMNYSDMCIM